MKTIKIIIIALISMLTFMGCTTLQELSEKQIAKEKLVNAINAVAGSTIIKNFEFALPHSFNQKNKDNRPIKNLSIVLNEAVLKYVEILQLNDPVIRNNKIFVNAIFRIKEYVTTSQENFSFSINYDYWDSFYKIEKNTNRTRTIYFNIIEDEEQNN